jgi:hypothetical protein
LPTQTDTTTVAFIYRIVLKIVQGWPYNKFYEPMKNYAKSPIYQLLKISSLELKHGLVIFIKYKFVLVKFFN